MVLIFLVMLTSGLHYMVQKLNYNRDTGRVRELQSAARQAAWGPKLVPMEGRRKVKIPLGPQREDGSIGRTIDVVVEGNGDVFFVGLVQPSCGRS
jgi:DnaJ family protein C protein 1